MARFWDGDSSAGLTPVLVSPPVVVATAVADDDVDDVRVMRGRPDAYAASSSGVPARGEATDGRRRLADAPAPPGQSPSGRLRFELDELRCSSAGAVDAANVPVREPGVWGSANADEGEPDASCDRGECVRGM